MTSVVGDEVPGRPVVGISGPSFASEVVARQPTAIVAASVRPDAARVAQDALSSRTFRVYTNDDVIGVELGGALKNVMAVATGIVEGVGLGNNSRAALITRGLHEMTRLGVALGARAITFAGLAGIGDLVLTCTGSLEPQSRARPRDRPRRDAGAGAGGQGDGRRRRRHDGERDWRSPNDAASTCRSFKWCTAFCSTDTRRDNAVPELMARELRSEQDL